MCIPGNQLFKGVKVGESFQFILLSHLLALLRRGTSIGSWKYVPIPISNGAEYVFPAENPGHDCGSRSNRYLYSLFRDQKDCLILANARILLCAA